MSLEATHEELVKQDRKRKHASDDIRELSASFPRLRRNHTDIFDDGDFAKLVTPYGINVPRYNNTTVASGANEDYTQIWNISSVAPPLQQSPGAFPNYNRGEYRTGLKVKEVRLDINLWFHEDFYPQILQSNIKSMQSGGRIRVIVVRDNRLSTSDFNESDVGSPPLERFMEEAKDGYNVGNPFYRSAMFYSQPQWERRAEFQILRDEYVDMNGRSYGLASNTGGVYRSVGIPACGNFVASIPIDREIEYMSAAQDSPNPFVSRWMNQQVKKGAIYVYCIRDLPRTFYDEDAYHSDFYVTGYGSFYFRDA